MNWYNRVRSQGTTASPDSWEHHEPWPGGRFNHYYFDLNRDWAWQTQQETKQRIALYNQWLPAVHADFHEMGPNNTYYFSPAAKPYHADLTAWQRKFQGVLGDYNKATFDKNNWLYFTREVYDLYAPTYGDTWPSFNGAIGMTYEQGGGGAAGVAYARLDGDTLTLAQRIAHHHAASRATIQATAERHDDLLREFQQYFGQAASKPQASSRATCWPPATTPASSAPSPSTSTATRFATATRPGALKPAASATPPAKPARSPSNPAMWLSACTSPNRRW